MGIDHIRGGWWHRGRAWMSDVIWGRGWVTSWWVLIGDIVMGGYDDIDDNIRGREVDDVMGRGW